MKKRLLVFLDNEIYGGSERLMYNVLQSKLINQYFEVKALYGYNKQIYKGLMQDYASCYKYLFTAAPVYCNDVYEKIHYSDLPHMLKLAFKFPFWLFKKSGLKVVYNFIVLTAFALRLKPDLIHINNGGYPASINCRIMVFVAALLRVKCVMHVNNQATKPSYLESYIDYLIHRKVSYFIVASKLAQYNLHHNRHFDLNRINILPNTVKEETVKLSREEVLLHYNIPRDKIIILELAFLQYRKGQRFLIEAMCKIRNEHPLAADKFHLILAGSGEDEKFLKSMVKDRGLSDYVSFIGYCKEATDLINAADVFALPSVANEDMPLVILSAMKLGKAIVASKFAGIQEEIESGVSGILIEPNEDTIVEQLSETLIQMGLQENVWGINAQHRYNELFAPPIFERNLLGIYNNNFDK